LKIDELLVTDSLRVYARREVLIREVNANAATQFFDCHPERSKPIRLRIGLRSRRTPRWSAPPLPLQGVLWFWVEIPVGHCERPSEQGRFRLGHAQHDSEGGSI